MGDAMGHLAQALAVIEEMSSHEFLFIGGGRTLSLRDRGFRVEEVPMPATYYQNNSVDFYTTLRNGVGVLMDGRKTLRRISRVFREFDPHVVLTSYEYFTPQVARKMGMTCVSIDNQHFMSKCAHAVEPGQTVGRILFSLPLRTMFSQADRYFINSFFPCTPLDSSDTEVFPPLLSPAVQGVQPSRGEHVLVYQTTPTFQGLLNVLVQMPRQFVIYGLGELPARKNLLFKKPSVEGFVDDLAGCNYVITNGGHSVISEALYLGKPVFSFPIRYAYEQFFNACMLRKLGYGDYSLDTIPSAGSFKDFEQRLDQFNEHISRGDFFGNGKLAARLEELVGQIASHKPRNRDLKT